MKILWITNVPSPYRVDFFKVLAKECQLDVIFECAFSKERNESWRELNMDGFNSIFLQGIQYKTDMALCPQIIKYINRKYDIIVVTNYASLTGIIAILYMRYKKIPFVLEGDGGYKGNGIGFKERLKKTLIESAEYCLATSEEHKQFYRFYGAKEKRIIKYPFTSIYKSEILEKPVSKENKNNLRIKKRIKEDYVVLSVGQFIYRKGYDILLKAAYELDRNIGFYIIGGKATNEYLKKIDEYNLFNVHFLDFMSHDELEIYYQLADLFVLPTREDIWGLVINEAFAKGLPVITTNSCIAGKELVTNECGRIIETNSVNDLVQSITELLYSPDWLKTAELKCLKRIEYYTIENMSLEHYRIFNRILNNRTV